MTGIYVRVERGGTWQSVEVDTLTEAEMEAFAATQPEAGWRWACALAWWIREHVVEESEALEGGMRPCPFCGGRRISVEEIGVGPLTAWGACRDCGATGPMVEQEESGEASPAVAQWNVRARGERVGEHE